MDWLDKETGRLREKPWISPSQGSESGSTERQYDKQCGKEDEEQARKRT